MGEVGEIGEQYHTEVGEYARTCGIDRLYTLGVLSKSSALAFAPNAPSASLSSESVHAYEPTDGGLTQLLSALESELPQLGSILVKGSRFMRMERVVQHVLSKSTTQKGPSCS